MPVCNNCGRHIAISSTERRCPVCGASFLPAKDPARDPAQFAIQWEYMIESAGFVSSFEWKLKDLGMEGWELVGIYKDTGDYYAVLKRPKRY